MKSVKELMEELSPLRKRLEGLVRRMAIRLTAKTLWQLTGVKIDGKTETIFAEVFAGIGVAARPPASGKPEAIVLNVGDAKHPAIIAIRDEATRAKVAAALGVDETMLFNSAAVVHVKADTTIEARRSTPVGSVEPVVKATTYLAAEATMLTALSALATAIIAQNAADVILGDPLAIATTTACTALITAITTFTGAGAAAYRTTVLKGE